MRTTYYVLRTTFSIPNEKFLHLIIKIAQPAPRSVIDVHECAGDRSEILVRIPLARACRFFIHERRETRFTRGRGADVVFDPVGGEVFDQSVRCTNWEGRILVVGFAGGTISKLPVNLTLV